MFVIAPEVDVGLPLGEEVLARFNVQLQGLGAFLVGAHALTEGAEIVVIAAGYADVGLKVFGEGIQRREGFGVCHVPVRVRSEDELGEFAHTLGGDGFPL